MKRLERAVLIMALLASSGCLSSRQYDRPFSKDWVHLEHKEGELKAREAHINSKKGVFGVKPKTDSKRGSGLSIGKDSGLGADVGSGGGKVKYGFSW